MAHRIERVNHLIRRELSELIQRELRDPRLESFIAVTEVNTSTDLRHAKIYISCLSGKQEEKKVLEVLDSACGFLRSELAKKVRLRRIPELTFQWDNSIEQGDRILRMIDNLHQEDNL